MTAPGGWMVAYWKARVDAELYVAPYQRLAVAMAYEHGGCPSCANWHPDGQVRGIARDETAL